MTRRIQMARLWILAGLAISAGAWLLFPPALNHPAPIQPAAAPLAGENPIEGSPPRAAPAAKLPPLPPRELRTADVLPALQARADAGDGIAACRLSIELMRCQIHARKFPAELANLERNLPELRGKGDPRAIAAVEAKLARALATDTSCALLPGGLADRAQHYLRAAALAGEPESRFRYASGAGFDDTGGFDYLLTPAFDRWRREAEALMQQSLADGSPGAALVLALAYANDLGLFAGLVADDGAKAHAHVVLVERVFGESLAAFPLRLPRPTAEADAAEAASADVLAAQWHQAHFGGRQYDLMELLVKESHPWGDASAAAAAEDPCPGPEASDHD